MFSDREVLQSVLKDFMLGSLEPQFLEELFKFN
jgi:hypothetical protein